MGHFLTNPVKNKNLSDRHLLDLVDETLVLFKQILHISENKIYVSEEFSFFHHYFDNTSEQKFENGVFFGLEAYFQVCDSESVRATKFSPKPLSYLKN